MILSFAIKYFRPFRDIIGVFGCVYFLRKRPKAIKIRFHKCRWWENDNKYEIVYNYLYSILIIYGYLNIVLHPDLSLLHIPNGISVCNLDFQVFDNLY